MIRFFLTSLLAALLLSGCTGGSGDPAYTPPNAFVYGDEVMSFFIAHPRD